MEHINSSSELNEVFRNAREKIDNAYNRTFQIESILNKQLAILNDISNYQDYCLKQLSYEKEPDKHTVSFKGLYGLFDSYFLDVTPKALKEPLNVFNIALSNQKTTYFREDVTLQVEDIDATYVLKHESIQDNLFYEKFATNKIKMVLTLKDYQNLLGPTRFNVIELDTLFAGSFDIDEVTIYSTSQGIGDKASIVKGPFKSLGINQLVLDKKYQFYKIEFLITLNYSVTIDHMTYYPFGIRHMYLFDADFDINSHVIMKVKSDKAIRFVKDECIISSNHGIERTTLKTLGAELYLHYQDNALYMPFEPSTPSVIYEIPAHTNEFYARIPLKNTSYSFLTFMLENI